MCFRPPSPSVMGASPSGRACKPEKIVVHRLGRVVPEKHASTDGEIKMVSYQGAVTRFECRGGEDAHQRRGPGRRLRDSSRAIPCGSSGPDRRWSPWRRARDPGGGSWPLMRARGALSRGPPTSSLQRPKLLTFLLLLPPLLWIGVVYVGSLFALLLQSFYSLDDYLRAHRPRVHSFDLRAASRRGQSPDHPAHGHDVGAGHNRLRHHRLSHRLLCRALRPRLDQGAVLSRGDDAALVELSGQDLRLEADPGQGRHHHLACQERASVLAARRHHGAAGDRRAVAVLQLYRHLPRLRLYLDSLHDPADPGGARAGAPQLSSRPRPISAPIHARHSGP